MTLILGAVAYDPRVVTIWEGFKRHFQRQGLSFDYVLYSNYERQVEALLDGTIHVAWNSPLAWVRSRRMARARHLTVRPIAMRDSDCDLTSLIVVRADSPIHDPADLRGRSSLLEHQILPRQPSFRFPTFASKASCQPSTLTFSATTYSVACTAIT